MKKTKGYFELQCIALRKRNAILSQAIKNQNRVIDAKNAVNMKLRKQLE